MAVSDFFVLREMESGETVELAGVTFIVGREANCNIRIDNPRVSRRHARLQINRGQLAIEDLESANGTLVNGKKIRASRRLDSGDVVTVGGVNFLVIAPAAATGLTVVSGRIPDQVDSFVENPSDGADTWVSHAYELPSGWGDGESGPEAFDLEDAERRLSKQLIRERVPTDTLSAVLFVVDGAASGALYSLRPESGPRWLLGRAPDCEPHIDDATVSRHHARILFSPKGWRRSGSGHHQRMLGQRHSRAA